MPLEIYDIVATAARYWFLFLMVLIVWRSYKWFYHDHKQRKKRLKLLPDAGFIGELVVMNDTPAFRQGDVFSVPREGTLGFLRTNDICLPVEGVMKKHLWFAYDKQKGLVLEALSNNAFEVEGETVQNRNHPLTMKHGSWLRVGSITLRLRMFAGFTSVANHAPVPFARPLPEDQMPQAQGVPVMSQEQLMQMHQFQQQQMRNQQFAHQQAQQAYWQQQMAYQQAVQSQAYQRWMTQQWEENLQKKRPEQEELEMENQAQQETEETVSQTHTEFATYERFYPPEALDESFLAGDETWPFAPVPQSEATFEHSGYTYPEYVEIDPLDEDMTDAATPPKSTYVGEDEAALAKSKVWDKMFGGGDE